jgi:hypothetical protein
MDLTGIRNNSKEAAHWAGALRRSKLRIFYVEMSDRVQKILIIKKT